MGGNKSNLSLGEDSEIITHVPQYIRKWLRGEIGSLNLRSGAVGSSESKSDLTLSHQDLELLIAFVKDERAAFFWKWVSKNIRKIKKPTKQNLSQFMCSTIYLVEVTKNPKNRQRNPRAYYKERIKELKHKKETLDRAITNIQSTVPWFTDSKLKANFSIDFRERIVSENELWLTPDYLNGIMRRPRPAAGGKW